MLGWLYRRFNLMPEVVGAGPFDVSLTESREAIRSTNLEYQAAIEQRLVVSQIVGPLREAVAEGDVDLFAEAIETGMRGNG